jgi:hypothetical protein
VDRNKLMASRLGSFTRRLREHDGSAINHLEVAA